MHHYQWLHRTTNTVASQQWKEDGNAAEYIVVHQSPILSSLAGFVASSSGGQGCMVQSVLKYPAQPLPPYTPVSPKPLGRRECLHSVYRPEIFMHHSQTILSEWPSFLWPAHM